MDALRPAGRRRAERGGELVEIGRLAWAVVGVVLVVVAGAWLVGRLMPIVVAAVVAGLLTSLLGPLVDRLRARRVPELLAVWSAVAGLLAIVAGAIAWIVPKVSGEIGPLQRSVSAGVTRIEDWLVTGPFHLSRTRVTACGASLRRQSGSLGNQVAKGALARTPLALEVVGATVMTVVLLFYFLRIGASGRARRWCETTAAGPHVLGGWRSLAAFARGLVANAAVNAIVLGAALVALRVPLAGPITAVTFLASFVPLAGAIVAGALAALAYRLTREALFNAFKHAEATDIEVRIERQPRALDVTIRDDGAGFDPDEVTADPGHLGLTHARELAEAAGGQWAVESSPGRGTSVHFRLPDPSMT